MKTVKCVDILLPDVKEFEKWAVVACDQFTSQRNYWEDLAKYVGDAPSTLKLIFPEVYLEDGDADARIKTINKTMKEYIDGGVFKTLKDSFVLVKRDTAFGLSRLGLIVAIDLEDYSYAYPTEVPLRATEGVVVDRIPPRLKIRKDAPVEFPHILVVMDDRKKVVIEELWEKRENFEKLYDFDLNMNGGHMTGFAVPKDEVFDKLAVYEKNVEGLYGIKTDFTFAVGDGNHSLATAQAHWNEIKKNLSSEEKENHPARFALVELENLHDDGIVFEPIHRFVFGADEKFVDFLSNELKGDYQLRVFTKDKEYTVNANANSTECIAEIQAAIDKYLKENKGLSVDYIHGKEHLEGLAKDNDGVAIYMPCISKNELFPYVALHGNLCRKAFSMGEAEEKRYYFEGHKIIK